MTVWVCGRYIAMRKDGSVVWELEGLYTTKEIALENCKHRNEFIGPIILNTPLPENRVCWPGCHYPNEIY